MKTLPIIISASLFVFAGARENITELVKEVEDRVLHRAETCGGIYTQPQFIIESPNYPGDYGKNLNCWYIFKGPLCSANYTWQFLDFNLEDTLGCAADRLEIRNKDALCGVREGVKVYEADNGVLEVNFVSDKENSARGFRILVSRDVCNDSVEPRSSNYPGQDYLPPQPQPQPTSCCASSYNSKHFFISSPNFPQESQGDCIFTIRKANSKVCRARIHMHYFYVGNQSPFCSSGFLQIDGKLICGCETGRRLLSSFMFEDYKIFRYKNLGQGNGFAIEIIQDECPERYSPPTFNFYNDQINRIAWPNGSKNLGSVELFAPFSRQIYKHFYYFEAPDFDDFYESFDLNRPRDVEEVTYVDTSDLDTILTNQNTQKCNSFGAHQLQVLQTNPVWRNHQCGAAEHCKDFSLAKGQFQSPNYPGNYPKNLNLCYRFIKLKQYCKIRLTFFDFNLQNTDDCSKDYFLIGNFRYCGQSLSHTFTLFDISGSHQEVVKFVTDASIEGRGFKGVYEQIPCSYHPVDPLRPPGTEAPWTRPPVDPLRPPGNRPPGTYPPVDPLRPPGNHPPGSYPPVDPLRPPGNRPPVDPLRPPGTYPPIDPLRPPGNRPPVDPLRPPGTYLPVDPPGPVRPPNTESPMQPSCSRTIRDGYFTIDIYDYGRDACEFVVQKINEEVCMLELAFVTFELSCDFEYFLVNNQKFCGDLSGRTINLEFKGSHLSLIYKRATFRPPTSGLKIHLMGRQVDTKCRVELPPVQRLIKTPRDPEDNGLTLIYKKSSPDVCGVVLNYRNASCSQILNSENCTEISNNAIYVPYNKLDKLEVKLANATTTKATGLEFKQITCDNKFIL